MRLWRRGRSRITTGTSGNGMSQVPLPGLLQWKLRAIVMEELPVICDRQPIDDLQLRTNRLRRGLEVGCWEA